MENQGALLNNWIAKVFKDCRQQLKEMILTDKPYWAVYHIGDNYDDQTHFDEIRRFDFHQVKDQYEKERLLCNYISSLNRKTIEIAVVFPITVQGKSVPNAFLIVFQHEFRSRYFAMMMKTEHSEPEVVRLEEMNPYKSDHTFLDIYPTRITSN